METLQKRDYFILGLSICLGTLTFLYLDRRRARIDHLKETPESSSLDFPDFGQYENSNQSIRDNYPMVGRQKMV
jgi:hypothetical protein